MSQYGRLLPHTNKQQYNGYERIAEVKSNGWIWALMTITNQSFTQLESHPNTHESFEPNHGVTIMALSAQYTPQDFRLFLLDEAILLHPGIWHQVMCLSRNSSFKIIENNEVATMTYDLEFSVSNSLCIL